MLQLIGGVQVVWWICGSRGVNWLGAAHPAKRGMVGIQYADVGYAVGLTMCCTACGLLSGAKTSLDCWVECPQLDGRD